MALNWDTYVLGNQSGQVSLLKDLGHFSYTGNLKTAIRSYQDYSGLVQTGVWTNAETERLYQRSCNCPDISQARTRKGHWDEQKLFIHATMPGAQEETVQLLLAGARWWSDVCNLDFELVDRRSDSDIFATYRRIDGRNGTLAWSMLPEANLKHGQRILEQRYDSGERWTSDMFIEVSAHEIGHAIGIDHVPASRGKALMNPFIQGVKAPTEFDIAEAVERYGKRPVVEPEPKPEPEPEDEPDQPCESLGEILGSIDIFDQRITISSKPIE